MAIAGLSCGVIALVLSAYATIIGISILTML